MHTDGVRGFPLELHRVESASIFKGLAMKTLTEISGLELREVYRMRGELLKALKEGKLDAPKAEEAKPEATPGEEAAPEAQENIEASPTDASRPNPIWPIRFKAMTTRSIPVAF